jgi:hypothetical protein
MLEDSTAHMGVLDVRIARVKMNLGRETTARNGHHRKCILVAAFTAKVRYFLLITVMTASAEATPFLLTP